MRFGRWLILTGVLAASGWCFPWFHIVPLKQTAAAQAAAVFHPADFAVQFWQEKLLPAAAQATPAGALVTAIQTDPATAKKQYARGLGLGDAYYYFLTGQGRIVAITDDGVQLNLTGGTNVEVSLQTGLIFGNALRDGCGLLRVSDYPNSQDFNAIAEALNHLAETQVLPTLTNQAKVGMNLSFSGCAEVDDESADLKPLKVIPLLTRPQ